VYFFNISSLGAILQYKLHEGVARKTKEICRCQWCVVFLCDVRRLLVTANVVPSSPILVTHMIEAIRSSETSVLTRATRRHIPEDGFLHSHRSENLKSYIALTGRTL
jgi:hypothetical protein